MENGEAVRERLESQLQKEREKLKALQAAWDEKKARSTRGVDMDGRSPCLVELRVHRSVPFFDMTSPFVRRHAAGGRVPETSSRAGGRVGP